MTYEQTLDNLRAFFMDERYTTNMNEKDMNNNYYLCEKVKIFYLPACVLNTKLLGLVCDIIYKFVMNPDNKDKKLKNFKDKMTTYLHHNVTFKNLIQRSLAITELFKYIPVLFPMCTNEREIKLLGTKTRFNQGYFGRNIDLISKLTNNNYTAQNNGIVSGSGRKSRKSRRTHTRNLYKQKINTLKQK